MIENFEKYIESLGRPPEDELMIDIDETMAIRDRERLEALDDLKSYVSLRKGRQKQ